jgi:hypothetical protein
LSYFYLNNCVLFLVAIIGFIELMYFDKIPENLKAKAGIIIVSIPFILIYLFLSIQKTSKYPKIITINVDTGMVYVEGKDDYTFEQIGKLIIIIKKYDFKLFVRSVSGEVLLETVDHYEANMNKNEIYEYINLVSNIVVSDERK